VETVATIVAAHRAGSTAPSQTIASTYARIRAYADPSVFITLRDEADVIAEARVLEQTGNKALPLYGVPVAIKDNIDVAGLNTTAACPDYAYAPERDSTAVQRLRSAGAIVIGKTNLDQFAAGLVGVRTPYGIPRNALRRDLIPGGSSSGSATAVAAGLVPIALGTDTAGSGRVPAMLNNIVGLKPSLGLVSTEGVVPACRTLDCVSIFALTVEDAWTALRVIAGYDAQDAYSRRIPMGAMGRVPPGIRLGVPPPGARLFFGDQVAAADYEAALDRLEQLGATLKEIDIGPFHETARLLYEGPWLAERYLAIQELLASSPGSIHPVTRQIIQEGARPTAAAAFTAFYRLEELRRVADATFRDIDVMVLPTAPTTYTIEQVLADPIQLNSRLGTYTNFVNLLDLCGLAVPASLSADRTPFGVTLLAPSGRDALLASVGRTFHVATGLPLGATEQHEAAIDPGGIIPAPGTVPVVVFGAHLAGLPLNRELIALGASFLRIVRTAPHYRFYLLPGGPPARPGLVRVEDGKGASIEGEVWSIPVETFGKLVADIPAPLGIGTVELAGEPPLKGFLAETSATVGARDITKHGGWRAFLVADANVHQTVSA